ncbi:hypothetical protein PITC_022380 [Penicillium italicum]|uniref:Uncharacterized protein n=1 Tax=Penicillium italicum TaxID=40296 RepID=A0A0A2L0I9_PENIT|nr:hypothetical protein PITC_022380 [Penicillium italicum]
MFPLFSGLIEPSHYPKGHIFKNENEYTRTLSPGVGPTRAPKYVFRITSACSTDGFRNLSRNRISLLKCDARYKDQLWPTIINSS